MIFETLNDSAQRGELMLVAGGMCHWHLRRDGQLTIREIISTQPGAGSQMLRRLEYTPGATSLLAKCPANLPANAWYTRRGFHVERSERAKSGRLLLHWRKALGHTQRTPNVAGLEVIYCANGNEQRARIAIDAGMIYGAQLPGTVYYRPYMTDQNHNSLKPDETTIEQRNRARDKYLAGVCEHRPHMATVIDWCNGIAWSEVQNWAENAAQYVQVLVIIPKIPGTISQIPHEIGGVPVRLGYSVPTKYGGTMLPLSQFAAWSGGVHLLGGSPEKQMAIYRQLPNVRSVDCNKHQEAATSKRVQFWTAFPRHGIANRHWPTIAEAGEPQPDGTATHEAFRRSCVNIMQAWRSVVNEQPLPLFETLQMQVRAPQTHSAATGGEG